MWDSKCNPNSSLNQHCYPCTSSECHKCALKHICRYSWAGSTGPMACVGQLVLHPGAAPAGTGKVVPGGTGVGKGGGQGWELKFSDSSQSCKNMHFRWFVQTRVMCVKNLYTHLSVGLLTRKVSWIRMTRVAQTRLVGAACATSLPPKRPVILKLVIKICVSISIQQQGTLRSVRRQKQRGGGKQLIFCLFVYLGLRISCCRSDYSTEVGGVAGCFFAGCTPVHCIPKFFYKNSKTHPHTPAATLFFSMEPQLTFFYREDSGLKSFGVPKMPWATWKVWLLGLVFGLS